MKWLKISFVLLALVVNLAIAQPARADYHYDTNPAYTELTQTLDAAVKNQQENGMTPESQQAIANLRFQKYVMETGGKYGVCRNETGADLLVYGAKSKKSTSSYDKELYSLPTGYETDDWDCAGVYLPGKAATEDQEAIPTKALKIVPGTYLVASKNPDTADLEFNLPAVDLYKSGEINWQIPDTLEGLTSIPPAPVDD